MSNDILLIGSTGALGGEVAGELARVGVRARALVRDPSKSAALRRSGLEIVTGDLGEPGTLPPALDGVRVVFLLSSDDPRMAELQGNLVDAAGRAGVSRIVKVSAYVAGLGGSISIGRWHAEVERQIEKSGMLFTHLRPFYFMQNFLAFAPSIASGQVFHAPMGSARVAMVDLRDVAAVAAKVLTEEGHEGKAYEISGPETLSFGEAAACLSEALNRAVDYVDVPPEAARGAMTASGVPAWYAKALTELYALLAEGCEENVTSVLDEMGVSSPRTFEGFAKEHAGVFGPAESNGARGA
jgi:uncharacterized protein YbjT (DUF2867 family)